MGGIRGEDARPASGRSDKIELDEARGRGQLVSERRRDMASVPIVKNCQGHIGSRFIEMTRESEWRIVRPI